MPSWAVLGDKLVHACAYAVLGAALAWGRRSSATTLAHGWLLALGALYGLSDEWHQAFVPGRSPDPADLAADVAGLVVGYGTTWALLGRTNIDRAGDGGPRAENAEGPRADTGEGS